MAQSGDNSLIYSTSRRAKRDKTLQADRYYFKRFYYEFWS